MAADATPAGMATDLIASPTDLSLLPASVANLSISPCATLRFFLNSAISADNFTSNSAMKQI